MAPAQGGLLGSQSDAPEGGRKRNSLASLGGRLSLGSLNGVHNTSLLSLSAASSDHARFGILHSNCRENS